MTPRVIHADSRDALRELADASIDAVVTDPPYALVSIVKRFGAEDAKPVKGDVYARASAGFMGKTWDTGEVAFDPAFWREVLRVMKPGAHLVAFGGTRTFHRLAVAIEDAGFEVRDQLAWLFGSGFPKSHDVSKAMDKAAGAEREVVGRKTGRAATPVKDMRGGRVIGGENSAFDASAITAPATDAARQWEGWGTALKPAHEPICLARKPLIGTVAANVLAHGTGALNIDASRIAAADEPVTFERSAGDRDRDQYRTGTTHNGRGSGQGRWPANVLHDGSPEVVAVFPADAGAAAPASGPRLRDENTSVARGRYAGLPADRGPSFHGDAGSAARFFYTAKADADDRLGSKHPTVKPVDLMAYLVKLITPPGGLVLDPFAGSGTTGMACMREGFPSILIEREAEYVADINRRIAHVRGEDGPLFGGLT